MKLIYLFTSILIIFLTGCSRMYTAKKFATEKVFYNDFNEFAENKKIEITLNNDSTFITNLSPLILSDSLIFYSYPLSIRKSIAISNIKQAHYRKHWPGIIPGVIVGIPLGGFLNMITQIVPVYSGNDPSHAQTYDSYGAMLLGSALGSIIGGVVGWLIGFNYTYFFGP